MRAGEYVLQTAAVLVLLSATLWGVYRGRLWSFPAAACFVLLAPTSSIIPIADLYFEHRMYLPAACILTLLVCGGALGLQQLVPQAVSERAGARLAAVAVCVIVAALGTATIVRNRVYADELILWQEIVDKAPHNPRGPYLLGSYYLHEGRRDLADRYLNRCIEANPLFVPAQMQYLELLYQEKRLEEAERTLLMLEEALAYDATVRIYAAEIFAGFGNLRMQQNRADEAMRHFMRTLEVDPTNSDALNNMAMLLAGAGRANDAIALFRQALAAYPNDAATHNNLGVVYRNAGKLDEAAAEFRAAIELSPKSAEARANLGSVLELQGRGDEALAELRRAVEIDDGYIGAHINLGTALARRGKFTDARRHLQRAVELDPTNATARSNLAQVEQDLAAAQSQSSVPATP